MLSSENIIAIFLTLKLAALSTAILLFIGTPLAWWLSQSKFRFKIIFDAVISLPLVLPPTVMGFYILMALAPGGPAGVILDFFGLKPLAFTFGGLVAGSVIYSLPFVVHPLRDAFSAGGSRPLEVAATLRASPLNRFFTVAVPLAGRGYLTAAVLGFAHTLGEFGVVLMIGGNIPGETHVVSIAIYEHVETMQYGQAHLLSGILLFFSFFLLISIYALRKNSAGTSL